MLTRIVTGLAVAGMACTALSGVAFAQDAKKPNILFIVSDDTGYGDTGPGRPPLSCRSGWEYGLSAWLRGPACSWAGRRNA